MVSPSFNTALISSYSLFSLPFSLCRPVRYKNGDSRISNLLETFGVGGRGGVLLAKTVEAVVPTKGDRCGAGGCGGCCGGGACIGARGCGCGCICCTGWLCACTWALIMGDGDEAEELGSDLEPYGDVELGTRGCLPLSI